MLVLALPAHAEGLRYRIEGGSAEAQENIRAHLGESPRDEAAAQRFLVTVRERVSRALEALGIYEHSLELVVDQNASPWRVDLRLQHAEPLRYSAVSVQLSGDGRELPALKRVLESGAPKVGEQVHHGRYEAFKSALTRRSRELGFFASSFSFSELRLDPGSAVAEASLSFDTGPRYHFGAIIGGDELIAPELLSSLAPFEPGQPYDQSLLLELRARLLRLGYFNSVVVLPDLAAVENRSVPITLELVAAPKHSYELGLGYSTDTRQRLSLLWRSPSLNRWGHSQQTRLRWSPVNPQARLTYSIPLDDPASDLLQFGARLEDNEFGDLDSEQRELSLRREVSADTRVWSVGVRGLDERWDVLDADLDAAYVLAGASLSRRERRGSAVDPSYGYSQFLELELASDALGSDQDLLRLHGSLLGLRRLGDRSRIVARASAGILWSNSDRPDDLPPSLAFFAGGDNSIRGFAYQSVGREVPLADRSGRTTNLVVGGTRLLTGSIEYQRYFRENWRFAAFVDGGDAFVEADFDFNAGVGIGIHYLTPVGAIRIEVAHPVTESGGSPRLHINIGAEL
jgi:translocation and assembly module TamA